MGDLFFSLISIAYSIFLFVKSSKLPEGIANMPGPGFFPRLIAFMILILSCWLLILSLWRFSKKREASFSQGRWGQTISIILLVFLYVLLWGKGNFLFNTFVLLFLIQVVTGSKWYVALIGSATLSVSVFLLFGKVFHVLFF
ncbi:hypothetical protein AS159_05360 [Thermotoga sp. Ku-13t]|nr:hypothetical protein AS159_05360 [Thermotoga sp. Ku-13t]